MLIGLAKVFLAVGALSAYMLGVDTIWPWVRAAAVVSAPLLMLVLAKHAVLWLRRRRTKVSDERSWTKADDFA